MKVPSIVIPAGLALLAPSCASSANPEQSSFTPYGFQSGNFNTNNDDNNIQQSEELLNDDSFAASMFYDPQHNLIFFTGSTYGTYFDSATNVSSEIKGAMGMSSKEGGRDGNTPHLVNSDCFLGILKLPQASSPRLKNGGVISNPAPWLVHEETAESKARNKEPELIYARRFGTPQNSEACSSIVMLPEVNDALLQTSAQLKLALLGHVNPAPLSSAEVNAMGPVVREDDYDDTSIGADGGRMRQRQLDKQQQQQQQQQQLESSRELQSSGNRGGFLHSLSESGPVTEGGRAYGFIVDFDLSLTLDETFTTAPDDASFRNAYGALLGGHVLDSSPLVYPVAMTQNKRDPNQLYVVSLHSDEEDVVVNPEYSTTTQEELDGSLHHRPDMTMGGAGGSGSKLVGGVPKYGTDFYVKVQQLTVTPYEQLMDVEPTLDEKVKSTMTSGWGFGFKLNDANDVRPSTIVFVKGRTPNEDLLLLGGTTRRDDSEEGKGELDGFITKLIPPAPTPVADQTTGSTVEDAIEDESIHPTKRIDSTTGRDETVTAICLPPPDPVTGLITHAFVVGSTTSDRGSQAKGSDPSLAYILKMRLDDLSTVWKAHIPSIHPSGILGGDVLGEGCAVSPDGKRVYLSGSIDGGSALNTGVANGVDIHPIGGTSDVFVVAFDVDFGNVQWAKQLGTVYEDKLARGGGVECDNEGNVIIMGSTRGGLQRFRPETSDRHRRGGRRGLQGQAQQLPRTSARMASDVFLMSLSRTDGEYVNAPYTGGDATISASGGTASSSAAASTIPDSNARSSDGGGLSSGAIAGISLMVIGISAALLFFAMHRRKSRKRYASNERMWETNGGDDFSYEHRQMGGRRNSTDVPGGSLRIVRGANRGDDWDDGAESVSRNATWMSDGGGDDDNSSVYSTGSSSSRGSYTRKHQDDNTNFLASLRQEANATMKKMVKDSETNTTDPRLDGGASIKSLLTHYREVKKGGLFDSDDDNNGEDNGKKEGDGDNGKTGSSGKQKRRGKPPPPPPPRRKTNDQAAAATVSSGDGLSEFTIV